MNESKWKDVGPLMSWLEADSHSLWDKSNQTTEPKVHSASRRCFCQSSDLMQPTEELLGLN